MTGRVQTGNCEERKVEDPSLGDGQNMSRDDAALLDLVGRHLATTEDLAGLADILDLLVERLGLRGASLTSFAGPQNEPLRFLVGDAGAETILESLTMRARDSRQLVLVTSLEAVSDLECKGSALAIPVRDQAGDLIGVLAVTHAQRHGLDGSHVALLTAAAYLMAAALRQACLANEVRRRAYELSVLDEIGQAFSSLDLERLLRLILERIGRTLRVNRSVLFMLDKERQELVLRAVDHPGASAGVLGLHIPLAERPHVADAIRTCRPVEVQNIYADPQWRSFWLRAQEMGLEATLAVPLIVQGRAMGAISLDRTAARPPFTPDEISLCLIIANQAAAAIENARLYQETRRGVDQLRLINEVGKEISSILDIDVLLWSMVRLIRETLACYYVAILLVEDDKLVCKADVGYRYEDSHLLVNTHLPLEERSIVTWVAQHGQPLLVPDVTLEPRYCAIPELDETSSEVAVPLKLGGRVIGVLDVQNSRASGLDDSDLALLQALAAQVTVAVENARLFSEVRDERVKLEAIIDGAGDVVLVTDEAGRVLLMNRAAERAFHVVAEETLGRSLPDRIANPDAQRLWNDSTQATSYPLVGEIELDDERTLYASLTAVPRVGLVAVMQDISHLKELDRMKSEFVSTVSHDLQSPLQAMRINLEILPKMGPLNREQREAVASNLRVLDRITDLVRDLLDLGRIEARVGLERVPCSSGGIIATTVEDLQPRARVMGLNLTTHIPDDLPDVYGDAGRLAQVIANLVDNAIKYTPAGGQIRVVAYRDDGEVCVEVQDNGPGIALEDQARLFEKFYRVPGALRQQAEGTGLGLSIAKSIVEAHGGRIWVESSTQDRHGSTFGFAIPLEVRD